MNLAVNPLVVPSDSASDEQLGLSFLRFAANAGTYQRTDSTIIREREVASRGATLISQVG
jgi:hypothetical protein